MESVKRKRTSEERAARDEKKRLRALNENKVIESAVVNIEEPVSSQIDAVDEVLKVKKLSKRVRKEQLALQYEMVNGLNRVEYAPAQGTPSTLFTHSSHSTKLTHQNPSELTNGKFAEREKQAIQTAIELYCTQKSLPLSHITHFVHRYGKDSPYPKQEHKSFIEDILESSQLNRSPHQVREYMLRYVKEKCGAWTAEADRELKQLVVMYGMRWSVITEKIGRNGCRERFRILTRNAGGFNMGKWSAEEEALLVESVKINQRGIEQDEERGIDALVEGAKEDQDVDEDTEEKPSSENLDEGNASDYSEVADKPIIKRGSWEKIALHVGTRNWRSCLLHWYETLKWQVKADSKLPPFNRHELLAFLKLLQAQKPFDESDINWHSISLDTFHSKHTGRSGSSLCRRWFSIRCRIPDRSAKTLIECIDYCVENYDGLLTRNHNAFVDGFDSDYEFDEEKAIDEIDEDDMELIF